MSILLNVLSYTQRKNDFDTATDLPWVDADIKVQAVGKAPGLEPIATSTISGKF